MPRLLRVRWGRVRWAGAALWLALGCTRDPESAATDALNLPTGLALSPGEQWLFVTNGNLDRAANSSVLLAVDLDALEQSLDDPAAAGSSLARGRACRAHAEDPRSECDEGLLLDPELGLRIPSGAGNIALDRPRGEDGPLRLLIPSRIDTALSWVDAYGPGFGAEAGEDLRFDCGQGPLRFCDAEHQLAVTDEPAHVRVDDQGFRFAYLPHLLGRRLTLLDLDGARGPEVVDVFEQFFRENGAGLGGGYAVAQRACDVDSDNAPEASLGCSRPYLLASQRYYSGLRSFRVAPGLDVLLGGEEAEIGVPNTSLVGSKPIMGGVRFEDPEQGERLLVVQTSPPTLSRVDTSLDADGAPALEVMASVGLCANPNLLVVHRPALSGAAGPELAAVSCYGSDEVAFVDLGVFAVVATVAVGDGPNELVIDAAREWLIVANTAESSLSIIDLSTSSPRYLEEFATIGLGTPTRERVE
ncbi:hypothetical protein G6O69_03035 [Pseudenhygromyxa sp. WMMC2535]|uniref:YncE family protein n=1 Tax=Pseudenhygromyxa sp. WMMC2535 TaxID=2712867 RepID=UPI0015546045|nr:hypothetical protein [Pseudenhygromyxa sp. WMMC2535]NVB36792.1 hypothetical protein [Pseudenhygromyxa sp. WMMC2535]